MSKLDILLESPDAEALATDLAKELSATSEVNVQPLSKRGVDPAMIISAAVTLVGASANIVALVEAILRWRERATTAKSRLKGRLRLVPHIDAPLEEVDRETFVRLLRSLGQNHEPHSD